MSSTTPKGHTAAAPASAASASVAKKTAVVVSVSAAKTPAKSHPATVPLKVATTVSLSLPKAPATAVVAKPAAVVARNVPKTAVVPGHTAPKSSSTNGGTRPPAPKAGRSTPSDKDEKTEAVRDQMDEMDEKHVSPSTTSRVGQKRMERPLPQKNTNGGSSSGSSSSRTAGGRSSSSSSSDPSSGNSAKRTKTNATRAEDTHMIDASAASSSTSRSMVSMSPSLQAAAHPLAMTSDVHMTTEDEKKVADVHTRQFSSKQPSRETPNNLWEPLTIKSSLTGELPSEFTHDLYVNESGIYNECGFICLTKILNMFAETKEQEMTAATLRTLFAQQITKENVDTILRSFKEECGEMFKADPQHTAIQTMYKTITRICDSQTHEKRVQLTKDNIILTNKEGGFYLNEQLLSLASSMNCFLKFKLRIAFLSRVHTSASWKPSATTNDVVLRIFHPHIRIVEKDWSTAILYNGTNKQWFIMGQRYTPVPGSEILNDPEFDAANDICITPLFSFKTLQEERFKRITTQ